MSAVQPERTNKRKLVDESTAGGAPESERTESNHPSPATKATRNAVSSRAVHPPLLCQLPIDIFRLIICKHLKPCYTLVLLMINRATRSRVLSCMYAVSLRYPSTRCGYRLCIQKLYENAISTGNITLLNWIAANWTKEYYSLRKWYLDGVCRSSNFEEVIAWLRARFPEGSLMGDGYEMPLLSIVVSSAIKHNRADTVVRELRACADKTTGTARYDAESWYSVAMNSGKMEIIKAVLQLRHIYDNNCTLGGSMFNLDGEFVTLKSDPVPIAAHCETVDLMRTLVRQGFCVTTAALLIALSEMRLNVARYLLGMDGLFRQDAIDYERQYAVRSAVLNRECFLNTGASDIIQEILGTKNPVLMPTPICITVAYVTWYIDAYKALHGVYPPRNGEFGEMITKRMTADINTHVGKEALKALCEANIWSDYTDIACYVALKFNIKSLVYMLKTLPPHKVVLDDGKVLGNLAKVFSMLRHRNNMANHTPTIKHWYMAEFLKHEYDCDVYDRVSERVRLREE